MRVVKDKSVLACFSDAVDGDLSFYLMNDEQIKNKWQNLEVVKNNKLECPAFLHQVHGKELLVNAEKQKQNGLLQADALLTEKAGLPVGVFSADCLPILLWSEKTVAAVHAGWRGSLLNIAAETVKAFSRDYGQAPQVVHAALGPCIGSCCLEMGQDVYDSFVNANEAYKQFFHKKEKWHLDIVALNKHQLIEAGLNEQNIEVCGKCTYCNEKDFFSFRRQRRRNGSMFSFVVKLTED